MPAHPSLPSALMAALHAIATVAVALLLAHGERIVIRLRAWLHSLVRITLPVAASLRGGAAVLAARAATPPRLLRTGDLSRRGPPRVGPSPLPVHA